MPNIPECKNCETRRTSIGKISSSLSQMILHHEKSKLKELDKAFARSKHNIIVKVPKVEPQFSSEKKHNKDINTNDTCRLFNQDTHPINPSYY